MFADFSNIHESAQIVLTAIKRNGAKTREGPKDLPVYLTTRPYEKPGAATLFIATDLSKEDLVILDAQQTLAGLPRHIGPSILRSALTAKETRRIKRLMSRDFIDRFVSGLVLYDSLREDFTIAKKQILLGRCTNFYRLDVNDGARGQVARAGRALYDALYDFETIHDSGMQERLRSVYMEPAEEAVDRLPKIAKHFLTLDEELNALKTISAKFSNLDASHLVLISELEAKLRLYSDEIDSLTAKLQEARAKGRTGRDSVLMADQVESARALLKDLDSE